MNTPICDFVKKYAERNALRLHMPGHKGAALLGMEQLDITEIDGADSLYEASGIICQSEMNASQIFGCSTYYSTEGSSQCIRAMLYLAMLYAKQQGKRPLVAAARNVHKTFLSAAALLDLDVMWLHSRQADSYLSCRLDGASLEAALDHADQMPAAVYLTSPDYLGAMSDIAEIAEVCHRRGILLLVDNAHGAYLRFLEPSLHPIDLGADICCDSAHKTLPVLTGGAYLHIAHCSPETLAQNAKNALGLFGSTSPSYLILQSLDAVNPYLAEHRQRLGEFLPYVRGLKNRLKEHGYSLYGAEPLKLTIAAKSYGYVGTELGALLAKQSIICEFSDPDYLVLMLTPETGRDGLVHLEQALLSIPKKEAFASAPPAPKHRQAVLSIRQALFSPAESLPAEQCEGRILAAPSVGCPPAVPILVCGERIDAQAIACFAYYGIENCSVVKEPR